MTKVAAKIVWSVLLVVCVWGVISHFRSESQRKLFEERRTEADEARIQQSIVQLANANGAILDWKRAFGGGRAMDELFTAELAPVFVRADGRPLLFIASLRDVNTSVAGYEIEFETRANLKSKVRLTLQCSREQANQVMQEPRDSGGRYAVVARILAVKSGYELIGQDAAEDGERDQHRITVASGNCIQFLYIGHYVNDVLQDLQAWSDSAQEKKQ